MKLKNVYCDSTTCIHRRGCGRWIDFQEGNYKKCEALIYSEYCEKNFKYLIRVRYSDGSPMKDI